MKRVPVHRVVLRAGALALAAVAEAVVTLPALAAVRLVRGRAAARRFLYRRLTRRLQKLGPTFVKFAQIAGARRDVLPAELCDELSRLHDSVRPISARQADRAWRAAYGSALPPFLAGLDPVPVAGGSIACVYRGVLRDGGGAVALKLKRPGIDGVMRADLALIGRLVRWGERLPQMRGMPMADLVAYVSDAILGQLDLRREEENVVRLRENLKAVPDVDVPRLHPEWSRPTCLVFDFVEGLDTRTPGTLPGPVRARLASAVLSAAHKMMFVDGFVHCDPHPGNIYLLAEGEGRAVILDAGYSVRLPDEVRKLIGEFFAGLASGDGRRCGEIMLASMANVGPDCDTEGFVSDIADLVERSAGPGREFAMAPFGNGVFEVQSAHRLYASSDFAFPIMSLMILESTVRGLWPEADFQQVGAEPPR
ncbi:AarF/ABC1/UbiB kinase family protein [Streptomyces sp. TRM64462]|uniref:ABC1 kinase family protein n=1 Tax=Streptomyces sp. TRM64462 TaxID=2741726 RepID=UPI001586F54A|nr:AarF/UbiB family protein [Streptomyces sp. TRM64462]